MVAQAPVKRLVVGSIPTRGAKKLDTNSDFEDERVRSPSPAIGGAFEFATITETCYIFIESTYKLSW